MTLRVSLAGGVWVDANLSGVTVHRCCCRPGCPRYAVATLTFVYSDSTAVVGPLATAREPHSWDLCVNHAGGITAPRGWELVRHASPLAAHHPDEDDLVALADAVKEGPDGTGTGPPVGFSAEDGENPPESGSSPTRLQRAPTHGRMDPDANYSGGAGGPGRGGGVSAASGGRRPASSGRRRGHLRVLPDPAD